jgi:putative MFS transporter
VARVPVGALFRPPLLPSSLLGMMIHVLQALLLYGLVVWLPSFFIRQGLTIHSTLAYTTIMSLGGPVGALIGVLLADRMGRKPVIMGASIATGLFAALYPFAPAGTPVVVVGFCMIASIYVFVAVGVALRVPELFPTAIRLRGVGLSNLAGRTVAMGVQFAVVWLFASGGVAMVISAIIVALILQTVAIGVGDRETSGRSLEALAVAPA